MEFVSNTFTSLRKRLKDLYFPLVAFLAAFLVGSLVIMAVSDQDPLHVYSVLLKSAFGSIRALDVTAVKAIPFIMTALSYAIAIRTGVVNLGADGQFKMGALAATVVGVYGAGLPTVIHLPLTLIASFLGGAFYGGIVAVLKNRFGASELITTIMMNYIATNIIGFFVTGPIQEKGEILLNPQSALLAKSAVLPRLFAAPYGIHSGIFIVLAALAFFYIFLWRSTTGYQMRVVGMNPSAGAYAGIKTKRMVIMSMLLAGGFAGLGGAIEISAIQGRLMNTSFNTPYGFTGIAVALVGNNASLGILFSGLLFGGLQSGALKMQILTGVSSSLSEVIQALVILFFAARSVFKFKHRKLKKIPAHPIAAEPVKGGK